MKTSDAAGRDAGPGNPPVKGLIERGAVQILREPDPTQFRIYRHISAATTLEAGATKPRRRPRRSATALDGGERDQASSWM
jgi:hypothetical protein